MIGKGEPSRLRRGKKFHVRIQAEWERSAGGRITRELPVTKPNGRRGRIDLHAESTSPLVAVVEIKGSNWDRMTDAGVQRNVARHAQQVWSYIESQLSAGKEISPGVIYPSMPRAATRRELIESLMDEQGIAVVWDNESVSERRARGRRTAG